MRRKTAKRVIRKAIKKYVRRRRFKRKALAAYGRVPRVFPRSFKVRLKLCEELVIEPGVNGLCIISMNSLKPFRLVNGSSSVSQTQAQPRGTDQWSDLYQKYCVTSSKVTLQPLSFSIPGTAGGNGMNYELVAFKEDDEVAGTMVSGSVEPLVKALSEQGRTHDKMLVGTDPNQYAATKSGYRKSMKFGFGVYKDFGLDRSKIQLFKPTAVGQQPQLPADPDETRYWGVNDRYTNTQSIRDPTEQQYLKILLREFVPLTNQTLTMRCWVTMDVVFFDKLEIDASTTTI
jgi:hypothetical protein